MKNKSRWDSLSIKDRATLINMYAKGGYTNIDDIRNHYNSFEEGGSEEEYTVPTRDEYITQRLEEARLKALEKSRTRTLPKSPLIPNPETEEEHNRYTESFARSLPNLEARLKSAEQRKAARIRFLEYLSILDSGDKPLELQKDSELIDIEQYIQDRKRVVEMYKKHASAPYPKYVHGNNCIYTATDNYGEEYLVSGNQTFASNPQKYGFKKIEKTDIKPGDLVQDVSQGYPSHAMIYNGKNESGLDTFNYSKGGNSEGDIVKEGIYKQNVPLDVFRFVGTAKDSAQYINDYNKIYGNKFQDGGKKNNLIEFKELPTYSSWEENVAANWPVAPKPHIDYEEIKRRQRWAESQDNPAAKSRAGAKGLFQIMPSTHKEYVAKTGKKGNIYDPKYNTEIRDWYMQDMLNSKTITNGNPTDSVQLAKQLAAYNWGRGNLGSFLEKQKKAGIDIYNTLDWINAMPKEPRDYVNFILRNKDTGGPRNNEFYNSRPKIFLEY